MMNTIAIDTSVYLQAEAYARQHNISLKELVETSLSSLLHSGERHFTLKSEEQLSPLVQSLIGVASPSRSKDNNGREVREDYLREKYGEAL